MLCSESCLGGTGSTKWKIYMDMQCGCLHTGERYQLLSLLIIANYSLVRDSWKCDFYCVFLTINLLCSNTGAGEEGVEGCKNKKSSQTKSEETEK